MPELYDITFTLNGKTVSVRVEARLSLADFLRQNLGLTGTHVGCEHGVCGACTILVDGRSTRSCLMLAVQVDALHVETVEGLTVANRIADLQDEFVRRNALQCGFCTAGILATSAELLLKNRRPCRDEIRDALSGNYCRCTGYQAIVDAIEAVATKRQSPKS
jgi:aerobic carbon-monoxide dehydrogenase small subunit